MKSKDKKERFILRLREQYKAHKKTFIAYFILRFLVITALILQLFNKNYENVFLCVLTLVLFTLPSFAKKQFRIELPDALEIIVYLFIFAAEILGELHSFYTIFSFWDTMLHTINGFLCAAIGFSTVDLLNRRQRPSVSLSPFYMAMAAFCFSMTIGVLWEFFEFGADILLHTDMQKDAIISQINSVTIDPDGLNKVVHLPIESVAVNGNDWLAAYGGYIDIGLYDTMKDLFVNFIGAVVFSFIGFFYVRTRGKGKFVQNFIPTPAENTDTDESGGI